MKKENKKNTANTANAANAAIVIIKSEAPNKCDYHACAARVRETKTTLAHIVTAWVLRVRLPIAGWVNAACDEGLTAAGFGITYRTEAEAKLAQLNLERHLRLPKRATWEAEHSHAAAVVARLQAAREEDRRNRAVKTVKGGREDYMAKGVTARGKSWDRLVKIAEGRK